MKHGPAPKSWEELAAASQIVEVAEGVLSGSRVRGRDGVLPEVWLSKNTHEAQLLSARMRDGTYRPISYRQALKSKGPGRAPRQISIPAARDRAPLRIICDYLQGAVPAAVPNIPQAVMHRVLESLKHGGYRYFVRLDIEDFYSSLSHDSVEGALVKHVDNEVVRRLVLRAVATPTLADSAPRSGPSRRGVPQGLSISNILAEICLLDFDSATSQTSGLAYFRYVDDVLIFSKRQIHRKLYREATGVLGGMSLVAHPFSEAGSKSSYGELEHGFDYLGYYVNWPNVSVRESSVRKLEHGISKKFARFGREANLGDGAGVRIRRLEWYVNILISGCILDGRRRGWIHFFSYMNDFSLLRKLDWLVRSKVSQYGLFGAFQPKSFMKAFRLAARRSRDALGYLPDFDKYSSGAQRELLQLLGDGRFEELSQMSDEEVRQRFIKRLNGELLEIERDLALQY